MKILISVLSMIGFNESFIQDLLYKNIFSLDNTKCINNVTRVHRSFFFVHFK
jgi:hypothetical protein